MYQPRKDTGKRAAAGVWVPAFLILLLVAVSVFAPLVAPSEPLAQNADLRLQRPGPAAWFGTDNFGRDVFSRVIYGARTSLAVGFIAIGLAGIVGIAAGFGSVYVRGWLGDILNQSIDVVLGFPYLVLAIIVIVAAGTSTISVGLALALALFPRVAKLTRASVLTVMHEPYILSARAVGCSNTSLITRHILPNAIPPIISQISGYFGTAVAAEATLSFLGLGVPPPYPSWGRMLSEGSRGFIEVAPWMTLFPALALSLCILSFALLGDGLRDLLDPKSR